MPLRRLRLPAATLAAAALGSSCTGSLPHSVGSAPVLSVATGLWPLAQVATMIGGDKAAVDDVVPAGDDPLNFAPGTSATDSLRSAGLVFEIGGGFQPGIEEAAGGAGSVTELASRIPARDPYVWLDPTTMEKAVTVIVASMSTADPGAAALFRRNAGGVTAELQSIGIDYSSTFSACPGTAIVTPDAAFTAMAADYGLHDSVVGPDPTSAALSALTTSLPTNTPVAGIGEPWVDDSGVTAASAAGHFKVRQVSTLAAAPVGGPASADNYFAQLEQVLSELSSALGCSAQEQ